MGNFQLNRAMNAWRRAAIVLVVVPLLVGLAVTALRPSSFSGHRALAPGRAAVRVAGALRIKFGSSSTLETTVVLGRPVFCVATSSPSSLEYDSILSPGSHVVLRL